MLEIERLQRALEPFDLEHVDAHAVHDGDASGRRRSTGATRP
jgi:hypothetical protein